MSQFKKNEMERLTHIPYRIDCFILPISLLHKLAKG